MELELWHIGVAIATVLILKAGDWKLLDFIIDKKLKPIDKKLDTHASMLTELGLHYEGMTSNERFFKRMGNIFDTAIGILHDKDDKYILEQNHPPTDYLIYFRERFDEVCHIVLQKGIDNIGDDVYKSLVSQKMMGCKTKVAQLFGTEFAENYFKKYSDTRIEYIENVCDISKDWVNSHTDRYRDITIVFIQVQVNNFIRFYFNNKGDIDE